MNETVNWNNTEMKKRNWSKNSDANIFPTIIWIIHSLKYKVLQTWNTFRRWEFHTIKTIQNSGVARNFWVMGHFPAQLFRGLGNNGQLKINWATIFLKVISITQTHVYRREIRQCRLRGSSVVFLILFHKFTLQLWNKTQ